MNDENRKLLEEEIKMELLELSSLETGSDKKEKVTDNLVKLYQLAIDDDQAKNAALEHQQQSEDQKTDRFISLGIDITGIVLPLVFYGIWMAKGFKFEETGTFTSTTFKGLFSRFRPTVK